MDKWLTRGLVLSSVMIVVRLLQSTLVNLDQTKAVLISLISIAVVVAIALVWGWRDGKADARANPDPEHRADLAMTWLGAGLVAGVVSGVVIWLISLFYPALYSLGLSQELTAFAALTALVIFLPATIAVALGRFVVDRKSPDLPRRGSAHNDDRADTDVFAAINAETDTVETDILETDTPETDAATAGAALGGKTTEPGSDH